MSRRGPVVALLCAVQFVLVLDVTIVGVALPSIRRELGFSAAGLQWVVSAYVLAFGGLLLLGGRLADVLGRRRLFAAGIAVFALGSLACGLAASPGMLVAARAVQGAGAALATPAALALVTTTFPDGSERTRALGIWTAAAPVGGAAGLLVGGALTQGLGWPAIFLVNVPVGAVALVLTPLLLGERRVGRDRRQEDAQPAVDPRWHAERRRGPAPAVAHRRSASTAVVRRVDAPGAALGTVAVAALVFAFTRAEANGFADPATLGAAAAAVAAGAGFVRRERRAPDPLLPLGTLGRRPLLAGVLVSLVLTAATSPPFFLITLHLQTALGWSPTAAGLGTMPVILGVIAGAALAPRTIAARGAGAVMAGGLALIATGVAFLIGGDYVAAILPGQVVYGVGLGAGSVAATTAGTAALSQAQQGLASALLNTAAQVGTALGLALLVGIATAAGSFDAAFAADAALTAVAALCVAARVGSRRWRPRAVRS